ncbi:hypothetical protein [Kitasatospora sp. NPDC058218]|uniref:hypothetical protein n=1 Tax=Kitasatospora sp. NPDC058218 TaxID=3346385 RepID=UPI0036DA9B77
MSKLWFGEWWCFLSLWAAAVASLIFLIVYCFLELRAQRITGLDLTQGICVYLDDSAITDSYQMGRHSAALVQAVEHQTNGGYTVSAASPDGTLGFERTRGEQLITNYVQTHTPIEVIGILVDAIEKGNGIVHANLKTGTLTKNPALVKLLSDLGQSDPLPKSTLLSHVEDYVLVKGRFRLAARTSEDPSGTTVFIASYAGVGSAVPSARVRLACANAGLRRHTPADEFSGSCLGKVRGWNAEDGALDIHPVVIFQ